MKVYHEYSGYIVFSLAILSMLALGAALNLHYRDWINHWMQDEEPPPAGDGGPSFSGPGLPIV